MEDTAKLLNEAIISSYHKACPLKPIRRGQKTPWWSPELGKLKRESRRLLKRALKLKTEQSWKSYKDIRREYKREISRSKMQSWKDFCEIIESEPEAARLQRILSKDKGCQVGLVKLPNGKMASTEQESLECLLGVHFPDCTFQESINKDKGDRISEKEPCWETADFLVVPDKVEWAISKFSPFRSPGPDGIFPALLQRGLDILMPVLCRVFRGCIAWGIIPQVWRKSKVVFIPKPGKPNYEDPKSFRPINCSSFVLKTLERLVDLYVRSDVLCGNPLHGGQHAYLPGRSCESALHSLVTKIERGMDSKEYCLGVFLDIQGAFNAVKHASIKEALENRGADKGVTAWIEELLGGQIVQATLHGRVVEAKVSRGFLQGGVISPILWDMVMDSLLLEIDHSFGGAVHCQAFADDVALLVVGLCLATVCSLMQQAVDRILKWCERNEVSIHPQKGETCLFTKRRDLKGLKVPKVKEEKLQVKTEVKYLGVILDSKLSWKSQLLRCREKAISTLWLCRRAVGKTWGLSPKMMLWVYKAVVIPRVTYAAVVWWRRTELVTARRELDKIQRLACLCITGALRTTPTAALQVFLDLPPLSLTVKAVAMATCFRLMSLNLWCSKRFETGHRIIRSELLREIPGARFDSDLMPSNYFFSKPFKVSFPERARWTEEAFPDPDAKLVFTDGSKIGEVCGAGVFFGEKEGEISTPLGKWVTVFQAELKAIETAARSEFVHDCPEQKIIFCSDSRAALGAVGSNKVNIMSVYQCQGALNSLCTHSGKSVELMWVPGHSGIHGNEESDRVAKSAVGKDLDTPEPLVGISPQIIKMGIRKWLRQNHVVDWRKEKQCRQAKELLGGLNPDRTQQALKMGRSLLRLVVGVLTGHCPLNRQLNKMGLTADPTCPRCRTAEESTEHYLTQCPGLFIERGQTLGDSTIRTEIVQELSVRDIALFVKRSRRFE